eukprot:gene7694-7893_t
MLFFAYMLWTLGTHLKENPPPPPAPPPSALEHVHDTGRAQDLSQSFIGSARSAHDSSRQDTGKLQVELLKILFMYIQYLVGIIAKLPLQVPGALGSMFNRLAQAWGLATGSMASADCLLSALSVAQGEEMAARAGLKGLIPLVAAAVMFTLVAAAMCFWWCVRSRVYGLAAAAMRGASNNDSVSCMTSSIVLATVRRVGLRVLHHCLRPAHAANQGRSTLVLWLRRQGQHRPPFRPFMRDRLIPALLITWFFWYPSLVRVALGMLRCLDICGQQWWVMDMGVQCPKNHLGSPQAWWAYGVATPAIILTAGLPLFVLVLLSVPRWRNQMPQQRFQSRFGFFYLGYSIKTTRPWVLLSGDGYDNEHDARQPGGPQSRCWHRLVVTVSAARSWMVSVWDVATHSTTIALTICSVYGAYGVHEYYQVLLLCLIFGTYLCAVCYVKPFKGITQLLQTSATAVLLATCVGILTFIPPADLDDSQQEFFGSVGDSVSVLLVVINALFFFSMIIALCADWGLSNLEKWEEIANKGRHMWRSCEQHLFGLRRNFESSTSNRSSSHLAVGSSATLLPTDACSDSNPEAVETHLEMAGNLYSRHSRQE